MKLTLVVYKVSRNSIRLRQELKTLWLTVYQHQLVTIICSPFSLKPVEIGIPYLKKWFS